MTSATPALFKKGIENYIDIIVGAVNFLIIIFPLILLGKSICVAIAGFIFSGLLIFANLYFFIRNNPFYIYFCYSLLACGFLFFITSIMINSLLAILLIPEAFYIYNLSKSKGLTSVTNKITLAGLMSKSEKIAIRVRNIAELWYNKTPELDLKRNKQIKIIEKVYRSKQILYSSVILSLCLIVLWILYMRL